jgi:hypothetical protein
LDAAFDVSVEVLFAGFALGSALGAFLGGDGSGEGDFWEDSFWDR